MCGSAARSVDPDDVGEEEGLSLHPRQYGFSGYAARESFRRRGSSMTCARSA